MEYLIFEPSILIPIILIILILLVFIAIIGVALKQASDARKRRIRAERAKKLAATASRLNLFGEEMEAKEEEIKKEVKASKKTTDEDSGDRTIYDDRKKVTSWQVHLSDTYKAMKKKNPKTTFQAAMKAAKKTYKKPAKKAKK